MNIEYDLEKDLANLAKHGVSLALGATVLENSIGEVVDDRRDYGEIRAWPAVPESEDPETVEAKIKAEKLKQSKFLTLRSGSRGTSARAAASTWTPRRLTPG